MPKQAFKQALLCWLLLVVPASAASETLQEAIAAAGSHAPTLQIITSANATADAAYHSANAALRPRLQLQSNLGRFYADTPSSRLQDAADSGVTALRTELSLRQAIPVFSAAAARRDAAQHEKLAVTAQGSYQYQQWMLQIIDSYIAVAEARQLQALAMRNVTQHEQAQSIVEERVQAGRANAGHLAQSRARLALARSIVRERDSELLAALAGYQEQTGLAGEAIASPGLEGITIPAGLEEALALALQRHPLLAEAGAAASREQAQLDAAQKSFYPELDFEISGAYSSDSPRQSFVDGGGRETDYFIGLRMHWALYNGGDLRAKRHAARAGFERATAENKQRRLEIRSAVQRSYQRLQGLQHAAVALQDYVANTERASATTRQRYKIDRSTVAELLDSQVEHFQAQVTLQRNIHNQLRQRFQLLFDCGVLDSFVMERS